MTKNPPAETRVCVGAMGQPISDYGTIAEALDAVGRAVYLSPADRARHAGRLAQGHTTTVTYGFFAVSVWVAPKRDVR